MTEQVEGQEAAPTLNWQDNAALPRDLKSAFRNQKVGVSVARAARGAPELELRVGLYRFADAGYARETIDEAALSRSGAKVPAVELASAPAAVGGRWTGDSIDAVAASGPLVIHVSARGSDSRRTVELVEKAIAQQLAAVKTFTPTAGSGVQDIPLDSGGVLARTLSEQETEPRFLRYIGLLTMPMFERRTTDPMTIGLFNAAGVDLIGWNLGKVARARDEAAAWELLERRRTPDAIAGVPELGRAVTCYRSSETNACAIVVGRFYATVSDRRENVARQLAAAQWVVLQRAR